MFHPSPILLLTLSLLPTLVLGDEQENRRVLAEHVMRVDAALDAAKQPLVESVKKSLHAAAKERDIIAIEAALASEIFLTVTINPEGRVKLARGPLVPALKQGRSHHSLVKIINQSGGQQRLTAHWAYAGGQANPFQMTFTANKTVPPDLVGSYLEYRLLTITCDAAGKHEVTITIDAGQGTQDLGFRGETPVLFTVSAKE